MVNERENQSPAEKSGRIIMFCDLRNSTDILRNFEHGVYGSAAPGEPAFSYDQFILDVHKTSYECLYLGHNKTHTEIYGDGLMAIFPEDNANFILENIYRLTGRMREYNETTGEAANRPNIDVGFGITVGDIKLVYYHLDQRNHPTGMGVHEAARIEGKSRFYDARILVSEHFLNHARQLICEDSRFDSRFIDRVQLKNFVEPVSLYEILVDNDPRFSRKVASVPCYSAAYESYCRADWSQARMLFRQVYDEYGLGAGQVMARRCDILAISPTDPHWRGVWNLADK